MCSTRTFCSNLLKCQLMLSLFISKMLHESRAGGGGDDRTWNWKSCNLFVLCRLASLLKMKLSFFVGPFHLGFTILHNHSRISPLVEFFLHTRSQDLLDQIIESRRPNGDEDSSGRGRRIHPCHSAIINIVISGEALRTPHRFTITSHHN